MKRKARPATKTIGLLTAFSLSFGLSFILTTTPAFADPLDDAFESVSKVESEPEPVAEESGSEKELAKPVQKIASQSPLYKKAR